jgi:hypothetical protein
MKKLLLILSLVCLARPAFSQAVYFCSNITENGEPLGVANSWSIDQDGGYTFILYNNGGEPIKGKMLNLDIAKQEDRVYNSIDKKIITSKGKNNWAVLDYEFREPGNYRVTVVDKKGKRLAIGYVTINLLKDNPNASATSKDKRHQFDDMEVTDESYYNAKISFCAAIKDNKPTDVRDSFAVSDGQQYAYVYIYVLNDKPLKADSIMVDIYRKHGQSYNEYINTYNYGVSSKLPGAYFPLSFYEPGDYSITVYNKEKNYMVASGHVEIEKKQ